VAGIGARELVWVGWRLALEARCWRAAFYAFLESRQRRGARLDGGGALLGRGFASVEGATDLRELQRICWRDRFGAGAQTFHLRVRGGGASALLGRGFAGTTDLRARPIWGLRTHGFASAAAVLGCGREDGGGDCGRGEGNRGRSARW
jgi:hypothetical protein